MSGEKIGVGTRHQLLLYRRLASYWRGPLILLLLVSSGLLVWNHPSLQELRLTMMIVFVLSLGLLLLTSFMSRLAYVQCRADDFLIQLPLYRLVIPYESVVETRAAFMFEIFPPRKQSFSTRGFLDPLWKTSAVIVRLRALPQRRQQLRLWMDSRMIVHNGLVLLVKDYMGLRREMQHAMIQWRAGIGD